MTSMLMGITILATFWHSDVADGRIIFDRSLSQQLTTGGQVVGSTKGSATSGTVVVVSGSGISMTSSFFWMGGICGSCSRRGDSHPSGKM